MLKTVYNIKEWISFRLIHPLQILTDTDTNIHIKEYHADNDFRKNTDIPIPNIPIIGLTLVKKYFQHNTRPCMVQIEWIS